MTTMPWTPEHPVDAALAAALVHGAYPDLAHLVPERVGSGWDCDVWRFGDLAFRFARRAIAEPLLAAEERALAWLGPLLPVAVPVPSHPGLRTEAFPHPWYGHPFVPGRTADQVAPDDADRLALAPQLGAFLKALHALDPEAARAAGLPADTFRGDPHRTGAKVRERLPVLATSPWADQLPALLAALDAAPPADPAAPLVPLHGDVYARHLLLGPGPALVGVIDWGDACIGDRAADLTIAYTFLPPAARPAFFAAYGAVDPATRDRARALGLFRYGGSLLAYAHDVGDAPLAAEAARALANALAPD